MILAQDSDVAYAGLETAQLMLALQRYIVSCGSVTGVVLENVVTAFGNTDTPGDRIVCSAKLARREITKNGGMATEGVIKLKTAHTRDKGEWEHLQQAKQLMDYFRVEDLQERLAEQVKHFGVNLVLLESVSHDVDEDSQETPHLVTNIEILAHTYSA